LSTENNNASTSNGWWAEVASDGCLAVTIDLGVYPLDAVSRCVYEFTDRAFVFLTLSQNETQAVARFKAREPSDDLTSTIGEFSNRLLDHKLRLQIASETRAIRELIVAQAFVEADLLDREESNASFDSDPRKINTPR
jgi:His-Xaa-Ser system protein HxsD